MTTTLLDVDHQAIAQSIVDCIEIDLDDAWNTVEVNDERLPRGIARIGGGCFRNVFRKGDWVYKIDSEGSCESNISEYDNYLWAKDRVPEGFALPETHLVEAGGYYIIVMEYIEQTQHVSLNYDARTRVSKATKIIDLHGGNLRMRDGLCYIIDMGTARR